MGTDSDEGRTVEELRERMNELEQKVSDRVSSGVSRREVIAGGGLLAAGGLLGGSATQEASAATAVGQIGTDTEPIDVFGAAVEAENSFTDPAGVEHTGELADIDDVGSGGGGLSAIRDASNYSGNDGGEQIQAAIDDLPDQGGAVFVSAEGPDTNGRWDVSSKIVPVSNLWLFGVPGSTRLRAVDGLNDDIIQTAPDDSGTTKTNIKIQGFDIDGNRAGQDSGDAGTKLFYYAGIRIVDAQNVSIESVEAYDCTGYGVEVKVSEDVWIEDCEAYGAGDDGFSVTDTFYASAITENVHIRDCVSHDNSDGGFEVDDGPHNVHWNNCHAYSCKYGFGIHTHGSTGPTGQDEIPPSEIHAVSCYSHGHTYDGFRLGPHAGTNGPAGPYYIGDNCVAESNGNAAVAYDNDSLFSSQDMDGVYIHFNNFGSGSVDTSYGATVTNDYIRTFDEIFSDGGGGSSSLPVTDGLYRHFDAVEIGQSDGTAVSTWPDQQGNTDLTQSTSSAQPTYQTGVLNGDPVVRFDGDDFLDASDGVTLSQPNTIFAVAKTTRNGPGREYVYDAADTSNDRNLLALDDSSNRSIWAGTWLTGDPADTNFHYTTGLYNGTSSYLRTDGTETASGDAGTQALVGFRVGDSGANSGSTDALDGDIAEILVYDRELSASERNDVENYLADKWGL